MINTAPKEKPYRKTTADWIVFENGEERTEKISVEYYPMTVKDLKARQAEFTEKGKGDPDATVWVSELILPRLRRLPDLGDADGKPIEITLEFLEDQDVRNLRNLQTAIEEAENPKPTTLN